MACDRCELEFLRRVYIENEASPKQEYTEIIKLILSDEGEGGERDERVRELLESIGSNLRLPGRWCCWDD